MRSPVLLLAALLLALLSACGFRYICTYEKRKPVFHKL